MKNVIKRIMAAVTAVTTLAAYMYAPLRETCSSTDIQLFNHAIIAADDSELLYQSFKYKISENSVIITHYTGEDKEVIIPDAIDNKPVKSIDSCAFFKCTTVQNITLPDGLNSIDYHAFSGTKIKSIRIPASVKTINKSFEDCSELTEASFAEGCTSVPKSAFVNCQSITSIKLPEGIKYISDNAFSECSALEKITLPDGLLAIGEQAFTNTSIKSISIPASVTSINDSFLKCNKLTEVTFADDCTSVPKYAFKECSSIKSVNLSPKTASIGCEAFLDCTSLENVKLPDGLKYIGENAFSNTSIKSISIPLSVTSINASFSKCTKLTEILLDENCTFIPSSSFQGCTALPSINLPKGLVSIGGDAFSCCSSLETITLPEGLKYIGPYAFSWSSLKSIHIPASVTVMNEAFSQMEKLTEASFADGCISVPYCAFQNCHSIKTVKLPESVSVIEDCSFYNCKNLEKINSSRTDNYSFSHTSFKSCESLIDQRCKKIDVSYSGISAVAGKDDIVDYTLKYRITEDVKAKSNFIHITITLPEITMIPESLSCENNICGKLTDEIGNPYTTPPYACNKEHDIHTGKNYIALGFDVCEGEGTIKFSAHTPNPDDYPISAFIKFDYDDSTWIEQIGTVNSIAKSSSEAATTPSAPANQTTSPEQSAELTGDVNGDGKLTTSDARLILQNTVGIVEFTDEQKKLADVNKDGKISTTDASRLLRFIIGDISKL